jgi:hypothetical protein
MGDGHLAENAVLQAGHLATDLGQSIGVDFRDREAHRISRVG